MQNNYYVLRQLAVSLNSRLSNSRLVECFTQEKEELILHFLGSEGSPFFIKAHLRSNFSCLSFPKEFSRARRNSTNQFDEILNQRLVEVKVLENDRTLMFSFENKFYLLFKLHGNRSNIILLDANQKPQSLFKNKLRNDLELDVSALSKKVDLSSILANDNYPDIFQIPTLEKRIKIYLQESIKEMDGKSGRKYVSSFMDYLLDDPDFYIVEIDDRIKFSLLEEGNVKFKSKNAIEALNQFFRIKIGDEALAVEKSKVKSGLQERIKRTGTYLIKAKSKLSELEGNEKFRQYGHLLMANLHLGDLKDEHIEVFNFYTSKQVKIKVNPAHTIQRNAERYYRKAKNLNLEIEALKKNIQSKENLLTELESQVLEVDQIDSLKALTKSKKQSGSIPKHEFKEIIIDDYVVLIGKNAKQNDLLTLKYAKPNDTWLHAKDVTGSHVVIKERPGQNIPAYILEQAAAFAAYYSKRKNDTLCPVMYTKKKYVRKKKGLAPGAVIVEKESVILVEPKEAP